MMNFIAHTYHWFGLWAVIILFFAALNFWRAAQSSLNMDRQGFINSIVSHLVLGLLFFLTAIPFSIGAIIAIIKYVQAQ